MGSLSGKGPGGSLWPHVTGSPGDTQRLTKFARTRPSLGPKMVQQRGVGEEGGGPTSRPPFAWQWDQVLGGIQNHPGPQRAPHGVKLERWLQAEPGQAQRGTEGWSTVS